MQAARATSENLDKAKLAAHDIASSRNAHEASSKVWTLWRHVERGSFMTSLARMLVSIQHPVPCSFYCPIMQGARVYRLAAAAAVVIQPETLNTHM